MTVHEHVTTHEHVTVHDEHGQIAGLEAMVFGFFILIAGILLVANAWGVVDAKTAAAEAAREAARAYATAPTGSDPAQVAYQAADATLSEMGWAPKAAWGTGWLIPIRAEYRRCAVVTYEVRFPVPASVLPWRRTGPGRFWVASTQSERVDPYRSGVGPDGQAAACTP